MQGQGRIERLAKETIGELVVNVDRQRRLVKDLRKHFLEGTLTYEALDVAAKEARDCARYASAAAQAIQNEIQPPLPGLGGPGD